MQFNVAQLLKEPTGSTRKYDVHETIEELQLDPELVIQDPITGKLKFTKIPQGILVTGRLNTVLEVNCNRCLEPFDLPVDIQLEEEFRPAIDLQTGATLPQDDAADDATMIDEKNIVDLSEVVRQDLLVTLPSLPTCEEACKGLCAICGQNLNEADCGCPTEELDPRWESLRALLDEQPDEDTPDES